MATPELATTLLPALARASLEGALLALAVWGLCRLWPSLPAAARAGLWWLVSLKLLVGLLPLPAIAVPVLPARAQLEAGGAGVTAGEAPAPAAAAPAPEFAAAPGLRGGAFERHAAPVVAVDALPGAAAGARAAWAAAGGRSAAGGVTWGRAIAALWLGGVLVQGLALAWHLGRWRGLVRRAEPAPAALQSLAEAIASRLGLARCPPVRLSAEARVPQVGGALRPVVLLPAGAAASFSGDELAMVLGHELAHVRRRDLLFGWAPALAERAFFFHPAARLAAREYALAREAACDHLVLDALEAPPRAYGRLLLRLGVGAHDARLVAAGASPTARLLKRRLHMLEHAPPRSRLLPSVIVALATMAACAPVDVVRRRPAARPAPAAPAPAEDDVSFRVEIDEAGDDHDDDDDDHDDDHDDGGAPAAPPAPPDAPRPPRRGDKAAERSRTAWVFFDAKPGDGETHTYAQGSSRDFEAARRARGARRGAMLFVRRDDRAYVIVDPATLEAARKIMAPQRELGRQQGELGARQGELGARQGELGGRQGEVGARLGALASRFAEASTRLAFEAHARGDDGDRDGELRRRRRSEARERAQQAHAEYDRAMREVAGKQHELARQQAALGERQAALGREQARLGERQREAAARAEREMGALLERAVGSGAAAPVR